MKWAVSLGDDFSETALHVYKRYIKLNGLAREDLIDYLLRCDRVDEVLPIYEEIVSLPTFNSKSGKTK